VLQKTWCFHFYSNSTTSSGRASLNLTTKLVFKKHCIGFNYNANSFFFVLYFECNRIEKPENKFPGVTFPRVTFPRNYISLNLISPSHASLKLQFPESHFPGSRFPECHFPELRFLIILRKLVVLAEVVEKPNSNISLMVKQLNFTYFEYCLTINDLL
jgi:hypothetical protein